jgi:hypothetical protein
MLFNKTEVVEVMENEDIAAHVQFQNVIMQGKICKITDISVEYYYEVFHSIVLCV